MNIFVLSLDPREAAQMMCDKHVCVLPKESAQMLSTVSWFGATQRPLEGFIRTKEVPYIPTHVHHPCVTWVNESGNNWDWLVEHGLELCVEFSKRTGKEHACERIIYGIATHGFRPESIGLTEFAQAMKPEYRQEDVVKAYRSYYLGEKKRFAKWKLGNLPYWWN